MLSSPFTLDFFTALRVISTLQSVPSLVLALFTKDPQLTLISGFLLLSVVVDFFQVLTFLNNHPDGFKLFLKLP